MYSHLGTGDKKNVRVGRQGERLGSSTSEQDTTVATVRPRRMCLPALTPVQDWGCLQSDTNGRQVHAALLSLC